MWKKLAAALLCVIALVTLVACNSKEEVKGKTLSEYTDLAIFQDIPAIEGDSIRLHDAADYGDEDYVLVLRGVMKPGYDEYVQTLIDAGYIKHSDNGENGIDNNIFTTTFQKDNLTLTLSYVYQWMRLYIAASTYRPVSPRLVYDSSYESGMIEGAKNQLTLRQMENEGNSYILQLKNGHFVLSDGGVAGEFPLIVDFLESLTPEGEKPYIEAWFISHQHVDHMGFFKNVSTFYSDRIIVEGFYINDISDAVAAQGVGGGGATDASAMRLALANFYNAEGKQTPIYRSHAGERYYFCDMNIEVVYTNEQILLSEYEGNVNASSTWLMYNIDGQKFLNAGDAEIVNMRHVKEMVSRDYMDVDVMNMHHHGINLFYDDLGYYQCETLLYSTMVTYSIYWGPKGTQQEATLEVHDNYCKEFLCYVNGSVVLTFPYTVGTYEVLPTFSEEWTKSYNDRFAEWMAEIGR